MDNKYLISVIVPVYNVEKYLNRCIDSIINQQYKAAEIILVDDGSTDTSGMMCDTYAQKYPFVHVVHKKNGGLSSARNAGMRVASGNYLTFIDSDDWVSSDYLFKLARGIKSENTSLVQGGYIRISEDNKISYQTHYKEGVIRHSDILNSFFIQCILNTSAWCKLFRRKDIEDCWFLEGRNNEDTIFMADIFDKIEDVSIIPDNIYYYFFNPTSIMHSSITKKKIDDAYFSAFYLYKYCKQKNSKYTIYVDRNICNFSTTLYCQCNKNQNEEKKYIEEKFNQSYLRVLNRKNILNNKEKIRFKIFYLNKRLFVILWKMAKLR